MQQNIYDFFYSHMRKHTSAMCVDHVLEGKMCSKQKEGKSSHQPPPTKKQRMVTECVLIPKHKYEQLEKDATKERSSLEPSLSQLPPDDKSCTTDNNGLMSNWEQMMKLFLILVVMLTIMMMMIMMPLMYLKVSIQLNLNMCNPS